MQTAKKQLEHSRGKPRVMETHFDTVELLFFHYILPMQIQKHINSTFFHGVLLFIRFLFRVVLIFASPKMLHIFAKTQFFALLIFSLGSYFHVSKMVLIFAGPKNRENKNTRSLKPRNGEPCEIFDV